MAALTPVLRPSAQASTSRSAGPSRGLVGPRATAQDPAKGRSQAPADANTALQRSRPQPDRLLSLLLSLCLVPAGSLLLEVPARASGIGDIVKALCLSAIETELSRAGKVPPPGMATYACNCVERQISAGRGIETARNHCRELTAQRFPI